MAVGLAIAGGLLSGVGKGMVAQDDERRKVAEQMRREALEEARRLQDRSWEVDDQQAQAEASAATRAEDRQWELQDKEAQRAYEGGLITRTVTDKNNRLVGIDKTGNARELGVEMPESAFGAASRSSSSGDGEASGGVKITASDNTLMNNVARDYWGRMNAEGQFFMPDDARDKYVETLDRAGQLAMAGVPVTTATRMAAMSISGPLDETKAREQAEKEARAQGLGGWGRGDERAEFVNQRSQEIMDESRSAQREYERIVGGGQPARREADQGRQQEQEQGQGQGQSGTAAGAGTQGDPYKPSTMEEFEALPSGSIYLNPSDGRLYRKN